MRRDECVTRRGMRRDERAAPAARTGGRGRRRHGRWRRLSWLPPSLSNGATCAPAPPARRCNSVTRRRARRCNSVTRRRN
eukprot:1049517-Pyramimonas_sp.AAC.1